MLPNIVVSKDGSRWVVKRESTDVIVSSHPSLDEALGDGRKLAKQGGVDLLWEDESGQTQREHHEKESGVSTT